jgi:hypothetical protein
MRVAALALGLVIVAGACASSRTAAADQTPTATSTASRTNVISLQEIRDSRAATLSDLVRQSRPGWNRNVAWFMNNDPDPNAPNMSPNGIKEIKFLSRSEAQMKWGSRYDEVIQVIR